VGIDGFRDLRDIAFCSTAICNPMFSHPDAGSMMNAFVTILLSFSDPHIRFYAGAPLINEDGYALGTLWL